MSMTGGDIENAKDEDQFSITGKDLKELYNLARQIGSCNSRQDYIFGRQLTRAVCNANTLPDLSKILEELKKQNVALSLTLPTNDQVYAEVLKERDKKTMYVSTNAVNDIMVVVRKMVSLSAQ